MLLRPSFFALFLAVGAVRAESPQEVADLVRQLGDAKFSTREAAQKELLNRGEAIVLELDRLARTADAETAERIGKVRYALVGYKDDIRRLLRDAHEGKDSGPIPVSDELRGLIASHQPGSGDLLVSILAQPDHSLYRRALRTFVAAWDAATPDQIDRYLQQVVTLKTTNHRAKFPAKVGAMIPFEAQIRDGWSGWPPIGDKKEEFTFRGRTTRYLDGKPCEKPFDYQYPFGTVGWYRVGELTEGKHTIHAVLDYEFTHRGQTRKGKILSSKSSLEVLPADTPDDLIAPTSKELSNRVRKAVATANKVTATPLPESSGGRVVDPWAPSVSWETAPGNRAGLACPLWEMRSKLDVDLCFDVELRDVKTNIVYAGDPLCVLKGVQARAWIMPTNVRWFAKDREGFVPVKVTFKPSRAIALSNPQVTSYYSEPIEVGEFTIKVIPLIEDPKPVEK